ncbi:MAG: Nif3-like dinuclear metal center hexameric protein [Bacteroidales bacterium]|nr:Nif3-like dinuclear metal center hexameric protein [Bacteroidales bacterium]
MKTLLGQILDALEAAAPLLLQEEYDNSGIILGDPGQEIRRALVSVDVTPEVISEAVGRDCDLVIAHHPLIFKGIKRIGHSGITDQCIRMAITHNIAVCAMHTNLDHAGSGVNHWLGVKMGLTRMKVLRPREGMLRKLVTFCPSDHAERLREALFASGAGHIGRYDSCSFNTSGFGTFKGSMESHPYVGERGKLHIEEETRIETIYPAHLEPIILQTLMQTHPYEEVAYDIYPLQNRFHGAGSGITGLLEKEMEETHFLDHVRSVTGAGMLRHSKLTGRPVRRVAVCGGSGVFLTGDALRAGAEAFVTADIRYHDFFEANGRILLVDAGHYETEQFSTVAIAGILNEKIPNFAILISRTNTNPVCYR